MLAASLADAEGGRPGPFRWQIQGLGFLKVNLGARFRLHVWNSALRDPDVFSAMHNHRWVLRSSVLCGRVEQRRYFPAEGAAPGSEIAAFFMQTFNDDGEVGAPGRWVELVVGPIEAYPAGETYEQATDEVHRSFPIDGTVTLVENVLGGLAAPLGYLFWPTEATKEDGARIAAPDEVAAMIRPAVAELDREVARCSI